MDRRWAGAALAVAALASLVVVRSSVLPHLAGSARPLTAPAAPLLGACVNSLIDDPQQVLDRGGQDDTVITVPSAVFGSCAKPKMAELVSLNTEPIATTMTGATFQTRSSNCSLDQLGYVGSVAPVVSLPGSLPNMVWEGEMSARVMLIGPTSLQRATGQHWSACVVGPPAGGVYRGSVRRALIDGALPAVFATCRRSLRVDVDDSVPCDRPHPLEILAQAELAPGITARSVQDACVIYARRALRSTDLSRAGLLVVRAVRPSPTGGGPSAEDPQAFRFAWCVAETGTSRLLTDTVIGLGSHPVPLS